MYRKFNNNSDTSHAESNQDKLETLLSAIEGTTTSKMDQNFAEVGTAIGRHHLNGYMSSNSSSKSPHGIHKEPLNKGQCLMNAPVAAQHHSADPTTTSLLNAPVNRSGFEFLGKHSPSPQSAKNDSFQHGAKGLFQNDDMESILHQRENKSRRLRTIGPPRTIFADMPEDSTVKGISFECTGAENTNDGRDDISNSSLDFIRAALLGLTTTSQVEEANSSIPAIAWNNPFTDMTSTSALINNDILISNLLKQLLESHVTSSHDFFHALLPYNTSDFPDMMFHPPTSHYFRLYFYNKPLKRKI
ncbi:predicted protein [Chaetoceros tenuissimus]|uniref:Uncharacterized protein n=1 Tax=Chaetoceros tenuissimus TaxID=426638 RepID=A0AAD3DFM4_9STRA|nr:predicted protein [Chaetoceros tenuissimus]